LRARQGRCITAEARTTTDFGAGWGFMLSDPAGAQAPGFDDSGWLAASASRTTEASSSIPRPPATPTAAPAFSPAGRAGTARRSGDQITFKVSGGRLAGTDNGRQESAENYKSPTRRAFNGKALAIVQSDGTPRPITLTATAPGLLPATTAVFETGRRSHALAGIETVVVRTPVGTPPSLPGRVRAVFADGSERMLRVAWERAPALRHPGPYTVVDGWPARGCGRAPS
jgi:hypothetical protein